MSDIHKSDENMKKFSSTKDCKNKPETVSKRQFLKGAGLTTLTALLGTQIPFYKNMPKGLVPVALASDDEDILMGKKGVTLLNDRPINAETLVHMLDDEITPTDRHFVRNNGIPPHEFLDSDEIDPNKWTLTIDGFVDTPLTLTIADLKSRFEVIKRSIVLECGGNGRSHFDPPARGNQWTEGGIGCAEWTGVRLKDVLKAAGVKKQAVYTAHEGADAHLSFTEGKLPISRGMPIKKALSDENILIAFEMNGAPIHPLNGAPLRLVVPGMPASVSHKWLKRIWIRDQVHDGPKMTGSAYRVPAYNVEPGTKVPKKDMVIIERMPVKSLITSPESGLTIQKNTLDIGGFAWSGERKIKEVSYTIDFGATWHKATVKKPRNDGAWQRFSATITFPKDGYYEVWAKATDTHNESQPFAINWNPKGYLNNSYHRIFIQVNQG